MTAGTLTATRPPSLAPSPLALGAWLAVALVAAKMAYWGAPKASYVGLRDYVVDLGVSVYADLVFAAGFGLAARFVLGATHARPRLHRAASLALLALGAAACVYAVASVQIFEFLRSPLTYPLLYLAGDMRSMRSSMGSFLTPAVVLGFIGVPAAYVVAVRASSAKLGDRGLRWGGIREAAAWLLLAGFVVAARATLLGGWDNRADHLIARNPHWAFATSLVFDGIGQPGPLLEDQFPAAYLDDFAPGAPRRAEPSQAARPRNVLLIVLESTGAKYLSLYGSPYATTPNLVAEAAHAVVFDNFYCHVGMTANSLAAITLSIYPYMTWREYTVEYPEFPGETLAQKLGKTGHRTAFLHSGFLDYVGQSRFLKNRGFDEVRGWDELGDGPALNSWGGTDRVLADRVLEWIDRDRSRPFYAVAWTVQSHHPYDPVPGTEPVDFFKGNLPRDDWDLGRYLNTLVEVDRQVGRIFDGLRARGLADDTLVLVTGDHGEAFGDPHPTWGHGARVYQENVRVPMMIWNPKLFPEGRRSDTIGGHVDVNPTVADLAGIPASSTWHGRSLFDPERSHRAYFYAANDDYLLGLREDDWKYTYDVTTGREEVYDLSHDPDEQHRLTGDPEKARRWRQRLAAWREASARELAKATGP